MVPEECFRVVNGHSVIRVETNRGNPLRHMDELGSAARIALGRSGV